MNEPTPADLDACYQELNALLAALGEKHGAPALAIVFTRAAGDVLKVVRQHSVGLAEELARMMTTVAQEGKFS